jgi:sec-independent protein translocase protein TatC
MRRIRRLAPEAEVGLDQHLEELRARIVASLAVLGVAFGLCFWQNHLLLELADAALPAGHERLLTLGVTEPFTTTVTVSAYAAFVLALPIILYQAYAFFLPALSRRAQRTMMPLLLLIPALFLAGVAFGYFVVLPAAMSFLLNFNDTQFNVQVQAKEYYSFFAQTLLACGVVFQVPVGILAVTRLGIVSVPQLRRNRRYAYLACAVIAAALPGVDPASMLLEMAPLLALYELSILLARAFGTPGERTGEPAVEGSWPR